MADRSVSARWRALSLILIGLVAGTLLLGTAGAHIGKPNHLWRKHLKARVVGEIYTQLNKPTLISVPCGDWAEGFDAWASVIKRFDHSCTFESSGAAADQFFFVEAPIPSALQGNRVKVTGIEICYEARATAVLGDVFAQLLTNENEVSLWPPTIVLHDPTDRADVACRLYPMNTTLTPDNVLQFGIQVTYTEASYLRIGRTSIMFKRTWQPAPPLS